MSHFEVFGEGPENLAVFYSEVLGWQIEKMEGLDYWRIQVKLPAETLNGGLTHKYIPHLNGWLMYMNVESSDSTIEKIVNHGGAVVRPKTAVPKSGWVTIVKDPSGNMFGLWETDPLAFPMPEPD